MQSRLNFALFAFCCLPAFAQLDSSALHTKYGQPLNREIFHMPSGFDLTVDYGISTRVCKLEVPSLMPTDAKISNSDEMKKRMYDFLTDLVPPSVRGKESGTLAEQMGLVSMLTTEYENVTVSEIQYGTQPERGTITIRFKKAGCQTP